jgi:protein arginine kinase activator
MLCDLCKDKEANVFFTQIINGQVQKVNLCEECSKQKGVSDPTGFALAELLLGMGGDEEAAESRPAEAVCPGCGFSHSEFKRIGRLGCPQCYDVFVTEIEGVLTNLHKGTRHTGKIPGRAAARAVSSRLDSLRSALTKAISEENFEDAVRLRDEINELASSSQKRQPS